MMSVSRDRFNYTEWRRQGLPGVSLDVLAQAALAPPLPVNMET